ncbi:MAG: exodeoxyribonuclease VII small subunit [Oscillospiraceae bacterium]|nr:exodeoxyribonuclease VII small subunit [Oscillospiraceae bacterium]
MKDKEITFEQKMHRIDEICAFLRNGEAGLEDSLRMFSEGAGLLADCRDTLSKAQFTVEKLFAEREKDASD